MNRRNHEQSKVQLNTPQEVRSLTTPTLHRGHSHQTSSSPQAYQSPNVNELSCPSRTASPITKGSNIESPKSHVVMRSAQQSGQLSNHKVEHVHLAQSSTIPLSPSQSTSRANLSIDPISTVLATALIGTVMGQAIGAIPTLGSMSWSISFDVLAYLLAQRLRTADPNLGKNTAMAAAVSHALYPLVELCRGIGRGTAVSAIIAIPLTIAHYAFGGEGSLLSIVGAVGKSSFQIGFGLLFIRNALQFGRYLKDEMIGAFTGRKEEDEEVIESTFYGRVLKGFQDRGLLPKNLRGDGTTVLSEKLTFGQRAACAFLPAMTAVAIDSVASFIAKFAYITSFAGAVEVILDTLLVSIGVGLIVRGFDPLFNFVTKRVHRWAGLDDAVLNERRRSLREDNDPELSMESDQCETENQPGSSSRLKKILLFPKTCGDSINAFVERWCSRAIVSGIGLIDKWADNGFWQSVREIGNDIRGAARALGRIIRKGLGLKDHDQMIDPHKNRREGAVKWSLYILTGCVGVGAISTLGLMGYFLGTGSGVGIRYFASGISSAIRIALGEGISAADNLSNWGALARAYGPLTGVILVGTYLALADWGRHYLDLFRAPYKDLKKALNGQA